MSQSKKRFILWHKYGGKCYYCGTPLDMDFFTLDHIIPKKSGGTSDDSNLVPCCHFCNMSKADRTIEEWVAYLVVDKARHEEILKKINAVIKKYEKTE